MAERIYLDHAATTPMRPEAIAAVEEGMRRWANPSSPHAEGRAARAALEDARARIKAALGWDGEMIFTSGASEAANIALGRTRVDRRLVSAVEHDAIFRAASDATLLPMSGATLDFDALDDLLSEKGSPLVAVQEVNSETGNWQCIEKVAEHVHSAGGLVLSDCSQAAGKAELPPADMLIVSAHKLGGPTGVGALLIRDLGMLDPVGGQEFGYRGGTENLPGALGFAAALEAPDQLSDRTFSRQFDQPLVDLADAVRDAGGMVVDADGTTSMFIGAYAMPELSAAAQLIRFDREGFAVSAGSACASGSLKPSRVLKGFGIPDDVASRTIRMSIGWSTTIEEIEAFTKAWISFAEDARSRAP